MLGMTAMALQNCWEEAMRKDSDWVGTSKPMNSLARVAAS